MYVWGINSKLDERLFETLEGEVEVEEDLGY